MYDDWQDETYESESESETSILGSTLKRIFYIFIVFLIIMGLLSPSLRNILRGRAFSRSIQSGFLNPSSEPEAQDAPDLEAEEAVSEPETAVVDSTPNEEVPQDSASVERDDLTINRIALITISGQVATINPDGSERVVLTSGDDPYQFPAWSPDGKFLAAISTANNLGSIFILEDDEAVAPRQIYESGTESPFYLYWSPDSQAISFLAANSETPMALHLVGVESVVADGSRKIATGGPFYWDWFLDGQQLLVHSGASGEDARIEFISAEGESLSDNLASPGAFQAPDISADGRFIAYAAFDDFGFSEVVIRNLATNEISAQRHNGLTALSWSPTQNLLAYTSTVDPKVASFVGPLRVLDAQTGESKLLTESFVLAYFWSPDGKYLAYFTLAGRANDDFNASLYNFRSGKATALSKVEAQFDLPQFELTIVEVETGVGQVVFTDFVPSFTFISQFMPFFDQYAMSHSLWSPSSDAFLVPFVEDGLPKIAVVSPRGGQPRILTDGRIAFWSRQ